MKNKIIEKNEKGILLNIRKVFACDYIVATLGILRNDDSLTGYEVIDLFLEEKDVFEKISSSDILKEINIKVIYEDNYSTYTKRRTIKDILEFELNGNIYHFLDLTRNNK